MLTLLILTILYGVPAFFLLYMALEIHFKNRLNLLHRLSSAMLLLTSVWFSIELWKNTSNPDAALFKGVVLYIEYPILCLSMMIGMHQVFLITNKFERYSKTLLMAVSYVPMGLFMLTIPLNGWMYQELSVFGQTGSQQTGLGFSIFVVLNLAYYTVEIIMLAWFRSKNETEFKKVRVWLKGLLLSIAWFITVGILEAKFYEYIRSISPFGILFLALSIRISILKYSSFPTYEERFLKLFQLIPDAILLLNKKGIVTEANTAALNLLGAKNGEVRGQPLASMFHPEDKERISDYLVQMAHNGNKPSFMEIRCKRLNGDSMVLALNSDNLDVEYDLMQFLIIRDITVAKQSEERISYLAYHDGLTGLLNRVSFQRDLEALMDKKQQFALLSLDLDDFKNINDTYGHQAGDSALQHMAKKIGEMAVIDESAYRLGGDEFVLLLPGVAQLGEAEERAARIRETLRTPMTYSHYEIEVRTSIGIGLYPNDGDTAEGLVRATDHAMYRDKKSRKSLE